MPVKIPNRLPARRVLEDENIFVMTESRALHQDIRPLKILILNLMPTKITTETQLMRCFSKLKLIFCKLPHTLPKIHLPSIYSLSTVALKILEMSAMMA